MADIPAETLPRLQVWWSSLEGGTQAIFEAIYLEAPGAVSRALSGGTWEADSSEPGLAAQLGRDPGDYAADSTIPTVIAEEPPVVPPLVKLGEKVTVQWTERNPSSADLGAYVTDIYVQNSAGDQLASERLQNDGLAAGASAARTWDFAGADADGYYSVMIWMNSEGADQGSGVPGPQGYRSGSMATFQAGNEEGYLQQQDDQAWAQACMELTQAGSAPVYALPELLRSGLNWLAASSSLERHEQAVLEDLGGKLADVDAEGVARIPGLEDALASLAGVASQSMHTYRDPDSRTRLVEALRGVVALLTR